MEEHCIRAFESRLVGRTCLLNRREFDWCFAFDDNSSISLSIPWRIVAGGRIVFSDGDDGHKFGLAVPVNIELEVRKLLEGKRILSASIDRQTSDLVLIFDSDVRLDCFNHSLGYEGWQAEFEFESKWTSLIGMGGGGCICYKQTDQ